MSCGVGISLYDFTGTALMPFSPFHSYLLLLSLFNNVFNMHFPPHFIIFGIKSLHALLNLHLPVLLYEHWKLYFVVLHVFFHIFIPTTHEIINFTCGFWTLGFCWTHLLVVVLFFEKKILIFYMKTFKLFVFAYSQAK